MNAVRIAAALWIGAPSAVLPQQPSLTVAQLTEILGSASDVGGDPWDEFAVPAFVAAAYGPRARAAVESLLSRPYTPETGLLKLEAIATAGYERVGVPVVVLLEFADPSRPDPIGLTRGWALLAIAQRADSTLEGFWSTILRERNLSPRSYAIAGMACALGQRALSYLTPLVADSTPESVRRVAQYYVRELTTKGDSALACGGGTVTRRAAPSHPARVPARLEARGNAFLRRIP